MSVSSSEKRIFSPPECPLITWLKLSRNYQLDITLQNGRLLFNKDTARDSLLIRKFVRKMKSSKRKIVDGQLFEKAANLRA